MTGHRVKAKKEMDMENQNKLGKYLVEKKKNNKRGIHKIHTIALSRQYAHTDDNIVAILNKWSVFLLKNHPIFFRIPAATPLVAFSNFQPL